MNVALNDEYGHATERKSRLTTHQPIEVQPQSVRSASQPPRTAATELPSSPLGARFDGQGSLSSVPWTQSTRFVPMSRSTSLGVPQSVPTRSSSFSHDRGLQSSSPYSSLRSSAFPSTFEDDESEVMSDDMSQGNYDSVSDLSQVYRGRAYSPDNNRSRSQSLAGLRTTDSTGMSLHRPSPNLPQSWKESFLVPSALSATMSGHGFLGDSRPSMSRLSSYGGKQPNYPSASSPLRSSEFRPDIGDISNISPFLRDVNQIFVDDAPLRDLWGSGIPQREESWVPGSGTTSRRHSVSVVHPRRAVSGLTATDDPAAQSYDIHHAHLQSPFLPGSSAGTTNELTNELNRLHLSFRDISHKESAENGHVNDVSRRHGPYHLMATRETDSTLVDNGLSIAIPTQNKSTGYNEVGFSEGVMKSTHESPGHARRFHDHPVEGSEGVLLSPTLSPYHLTAHGSQYPPHEPLLLTSQEAPRKAHATQPAASELGKGLPLHSLPYSCPLYIVEFKAGRTDLFYTADGAPRVTNGDLVIVEADRGKDLGKVVNDTITHSQLEEWQATQQLSNDSPVSPGGHSGRKELNPKRIYGRATAQDTQLLITKAQDEDKALQLCQSKVKQKKLPMEVIDAEYQWDRRKLTFYFVADKRIDFRELVRELFRLYKTRIWMASLSQATFGTEQ